MSNVKIQGNASGTGTLTIAAPNTSTDRTLTLPDATGTVQVSGQPVSATTGTFSGTVSGGSTIGVGGATPSASGAGITFPATQNASSNANTLDDYEEGTWTPELQFGGGTTGITYSARSGTYTKVGRLVQIGLRIVLSNKGSSTGLAKIENLPFTAGSAKTGGSVFYVANMNSIGSGIALGNTGSTANVELFTYSSTATNNLTDANFNNNSVFEMSMVYIA